MRHRPRIRGQHAAQAVLEAQVAVAELLQDGREIRVKKRVGEVIRKLHAVAEEHAGTVAAEQAREAIAELEAKQKR